MRYFLDTNIFINVGKSLDFQNHLNKTLSIFELEHQLFYSAVVVGELMSLNLRSRKGTKRLNRMANMLDECIKLPFDDAILPLYADIDSFSLGKHPTRKLEGGARPMGKNDIWIAATAAKYNAELITCDKDFLHLDGEFLKVHYIDANEVMFSK